MPLALLLHDTWRTLARDARRAGLRAGPVVDIGERLALVGQRMRTAYLVRWFGSGVPTRGSALRVSFVNLRELLARATNVRDRQAPTAPDAGMAGETVMGMMGAFAGWTFSLGVQFVAGVSVMISMLKHGAENWYQVLFGIANTFSLGAIGTGVGVAVGAVSPALAAVREEVRGSALGLSALYEGIVALAGPLRTFWDQLTGPRDQIPNPGLRALMAAADRAAVLVPHLFGAVAYLVVRLVPRLVPLAEATRFLVSFATSLVGGITEAVDSLVDLLKELFAPKTGPGLLTVLVGRLVGLFAAFGDAVGTGLREAAGALLHVGDVARGALSTGFAQIEAVARESILEHPVTKVKPLLDGLPLAGTLLLLLAVTAWNAYVSAKGKPGWAFTTVPFGTPSSPKPPTFPPFPTLPLLKLRPLGAIATGEFDRSGTPPDPFALTPEADRALRYRPPSVFGPAAVETTRRWQDSARVRETALRLLPGLRALLPAVAQPYLTDVAAILGDEAAKAEVKARATKGVPGAGAAKGTEVAAAVTAGRKEPEPPLPVKPPPPPLRVRPRVRNLFVEVPSGVGRARADHWVATLRKALDAAPITVPAPGPASVPAVTP